MNVDSPAIIEVDQARVDVARYASPLTTRNRIGRAIWNIVWLLLFRPSPTFCFAWRRVLLRLFGAKLTGTSRVYPSCRIWAPWNLTMGRECSLSHHVDCYSVDTVTIGDNATVSQYAFLCTATHDITDPHMKLVTAPIVIEDQAWVCAGAFVAPGVTIGQGAVAGARAVVMRDVESWTVVAGNPARVIKRREIRGQHQDA